MEQPENAVAQLTSFIYNMAVNTLYSEGSQCNESPLMAAFALQQMMVQSWSNKINIIATLPSAWSDMKIFRMRTEGAFLVSVVYANSSLQAVLIESLAGEECILEVHFNGSPLSMEPKGVATMTAPNVYAVNISANQSAWLWVESANITNPNVDIFAPKLFDSSTANYFGKKSVSPPPPPPLTKNTLIMKKCSDPTVSTWSIVDVDSNGHVILTTDNSHECMNIGLDTRLNVSACVKGKSSETFTRKNYNETVFQLIGPNGLCASVNGGSPNPGTYLQMWECQAGPISERGNEYWYMNNGKLLSYRSGENNQPLTCVSTP
eukprot:m.86652 g.86652  ORF g.86652 m.86652 type:complete len:320 (+) comp13063_c0_seq1:1892-2851(+)